MQITFYTSTANPKDLDKTGKITAIGTAKILTPIRGVGTLNPVISVDYNAAFASANYAYISAPISRYCFVKTSIDTAGKLIAECSVDVLYTWRDYIKNCPANIIRAEQAGVNYVVDRQLPIDSSRFFIEGKRFDLTPLQYTEDAPYKYLLITN